MGKYGAVFRLSVIRTLKNYKELIGLNIFLVTCLLIFSHLWKVAAAKMGVFHLDPKQLLWYIAFNEWVLIAIPEVQSDMEQDLRSGRLAYLLPRPISYLGSTFCEGLGVLVVNWLVLGVVAISFTWVSAEGMPFSLPGLGLISALTLFAGCLGMLFNMIVGLSAFWLQDVGPCAWIWEKMLFTLGGLMIPLAIYPEWLQRIAAKTPFPAILGERSALAIDFTWDRVLQVVSSMTLWGVVALTLLFFLYRRGLRILNIEGG